MHGRVFLSPGSCVCLCVCVLGQGWWEEAKSTQGRGKCFSVSGVVCELLKSPQGFSG